MRILANLAKIVAVLALLVFFFMPVHSFDQFFYAQAR
jgi:hypothetical protein